MAEVPNFKNYIRRFSGQGGGESQKFWFDILGSGVGNELEVVLNGGVSYDDILSYPPLNLQVADRIAEIQTLDPGISLSDARFQAQEEILVPLQFNWFTIIRAIDTNVGNRLYLLENPPTE